jgi:hypothetical protein
MRTKYVIESKKQIEIPYDDIIAYLFFDVYVRLDSNPFTLELEEAQVFDTEDQADFIMKMMKLVDFKVVELAYPEPGVKGI